MMKTKSKRFANNGTHILPFLALAGSACIGLWAQPLAAADGDKVIRVNRNFVEDGPVKFVPDEFVVEFNAQARRQVVTGLDRAGAVTVNLPSVQALVNRHNVARLNRQFPGAKPQAAKSKFQDITGYYKVKIGAGANLDEAMAEFDRNPHVDHTEKIGIHRMYGCASGTALSPNDTYYDNPPPTFVWPQWDLWDTEGIDADFAWTLETGDPSVVVVAMDSGVRYFHADLGGPNPPGPADNSTNGNIWVNPFEIPGNGIDDEGNGRIDDVIGYDFVTGVTGCKTGEDCSGVDNDPRDFNGHGTHTAGTMAAITNNSGGVAGIAGGFGDGTSGSAGNGSKIMCCRIGWSDPQGNGFVRSDFAAQAIAYVTDMKNRGVNIAAVNASWGSSNSGGMDAAVNNLLAADVMLIHAAGNGGSNTPDYLGNKAGVVNVAASTKTGTRASFSDYGSWVDIAAPGVDIISTYHLDSDPASDYVSISDGTSMSAPHVAGVAALLESCDPTLSGPDKFALMVNNTCAAASPDIGGILNAKLALEAAGCGISCTSDGECDDGDACNGAETCDIPSGNCQSGTPVNCDDSDPCTTDSCDSGSGACSNDPLNCDDGQYCTGSESCVGGSCQSTGDPCSSGTVCNESTDTCDTPVCDNDGACEAGEDCNNCPNDCRQKVNGNPSSRYCCDGDLPDCGDSRCNESGWVCGGGGGGCTLDSECDDGQWCNGSETCSGGSCQGGSDPCPGQGCDEGSQTCVSCAGNKASCSVNSDCCSNNCKNGSCKGN